MWPRSGTERERMRKTADKWEEDKRKREQKEVERAEREVRDRDAERARQSKKDERERKKAEVAQAIALRARERERKRNEKLQKAQDKVKAKQPTQRRSASDLPGLEAEYQVDELGQREMMEEGSDVDRSEDEDGKDGGSIDQPRRESLWDCQDNENNEDEEDDGDDEDDDEDDGHDVFGHWKDHKDHEVRADEAESEDDWDYDIERYQQEGERAQEIEEASFCASGSDSDVPSRYKRARMSAEMTWFIS